MTDRTVPTVTNESASNALGMANSVRTQYSRVQVPTLAAAFAYHWVFAIPPLTVLIVMVAALMNSVTDVPVVENLRDLITDRAPAESQPLLIDLVDNAVGEVSGGLASFGVVITALIALWSVSNAVGILFTGFNQAYGVLEDRPMVQKRLRVLGATLALVLFVNLAFASLIFGQRIGDWVADWLGFGGAFTTFWSIARLPIGILAVGVMLSALYWAGPNVQQPFKWVTAGSAIATILWLALIAGFSLYMGISNPASAYGLVGSVIVLLVFLNLTGMIFFLGAVINATLYEMAELRPIPFADGPAMVTVNQ